MNANQSENTSSGKMPCDWCVLRATDCQIATIIQDDARSLQEKIDAIRNSLTHEKFALDGGYDERMHHVTWESELGETSIAHHGDPSQCHAG